MAFKFVALFALVAVANAGLIGSPVAYSAGYASPYGASPYAASPYAASPYGHSIATPAITSQSANILRSYGNLGQVSTYSKTIDTPYSSVRKSDVRVSNPGYSTYAAAPVAYAAAPVAHAYAAPVAHATYAAPLAHATYAAPVAHAAYAAPVAHAAYGPSVAGHGLLGVAYSAAPAVAHVSYSNALGLNYGW